MNNAINMNIVLSSHSHHLRDYFKRLSQIFAIITAFVLPLSTAALMICFSAAVLCCVLAGDWQEKLLILRHNPVAFMFVVFFSLFLVGFSYTIAPRADAVHMLIKYSKFLLGFFLFSIFRQEKTAVYAFAAFLLATSITLLLSYVKFWGPGDFLHRFPDSGIFKDHIFTGFLFAFATFCYAELFFSIKKWWRWFFALLFLFAIFNVFFINVGRSGYVVLLSLLLLLAWQHFSWKGFLAAFCISVFLVGCLLWLPANFKEQLHLVNSNIKQYEHGEVNTSVGLRLQFYKNSFSLLQQHPWIGTGTGSFAQDYLKIVNNEQYVTQNPHNEYLNIAVQFGLMGIMVLLALFGGHWYESNRLPCIKRHMAQAVLVAIAVGSLFNSWLMDVTQGCFYVFFTALLFANLPVSFKRNIS